MEKKTYKAPCIDVCRYETESDLATISAKTNNGNVWEYDESEDEDYKPTKDE